MQIVSAYKVCTRCGERKPATPDYFYKNKTKSGGLETQCKGCNRKTDLVRQKRNNSFISAKRRVYHKANREFLLAQKRNYFKLSGAILKKNQQALSKKLGVCIISGCKETSVNALYCRRHNAIHSAASKRLHSNRLLKGLCVVPGCKEPRVNKRKCKTHQAKADRLQTVRVGVRVKSGLCSIVGCLRDSNAEWYCDYHKHKRQQAKEKRKKELLAA